MALEPFLINPPRRRRMLLAYGLNPKRKRAARRRGSRRKARRGNPFTTVHFPPRTERLFRAAKSGRWGRKKRSATAQRRTTPAIRRSEPMSHRKRRRNPVVLGANPRRKSRRGRAHRRQNPMILGTNPRRRRHFRRHNPVLSTARIGLPPLSEILSLTGGALIARAGIPRVLVAVPFLSKNPVVRAFSRIGLVLAGGFLAKKALGDKAKVFIYGALANQLPEAVNDVLSLAGIKLSDGNQDLELYTMSDGPEEIEAGEEEVSLYTVSDGDQEPIALSVG